MRHTPGPWRVLNQSNIVDVDEQSIAAVCIGGETVNCLSFHWSHRNARLIAAAPDLLELALMVKEATDNGFMPHHNIRNKVEEIIERLEVE